MRFALFGDVHGNLVALERFIEVVADSVDGYVCLGDTVNYGPWNDECLELISELPGVTALQGNHEELFLRDRAIDCELPLVQLFFNHSSQFFSRQDLIKDLPSFVDCGSFRCAHTIRGISIYPDTAIEIDRDYVVGHSHHQFSLLRSGFRLVNPGSVGQNRKWIDVVDFAVLNTTTGRVTLDSANYDVDLFIDELRARGYPDACLDYYSGKKRLNG